MSNQIDPYGSSANSQAKVGSVLYYSITAAIVVALAVAVVVAKYYYQRKHRRNHQRLIDVERAAQTRRGEAEGLPTYGEREAAGTTRVPVATLAYPEMAYRGAGQEWAHISAIDGTSHPGAQHDLALPTYDTPIEPPKYDLSHEEHAQSARQAAQDDTLTAQPAAVPASIVGTTAPSVRNLTTVAPAAEGEMRETGERRQPVSYVAQQPNEMASAQHVEPMSDIPLREERST